MLASSPRIAMLVLAGGVATMLMAGGQAQAPGSALVEQLRQGGCVLVMRHASSPRERPSRQTANADNVNLERQLDEGGRAGAAAMGKALRGLKVPISAVLTSPTYRAMETVRQAQLPDPRTQQELGDGGQSMQGISEAAAQWLRNRAEALPQSGNAIIVTHMPNIARAFPDWGNVADGEVVVIGRDASGVVRPLGRIRIEDWPTLR